MKAIITKYLPATNYKPSRVKAFDSDGNSLTVSFHAYDSDTQAYRAAAEGLRDKMGWTGRLIGGGTKDGYVFVFAGSEV